jgi:hypothetical protein
MADHRACHGCIDGCTRETAVHCVICVNQAWPCDASMLKDVLMGAAAEVHRRRKHPPYGSSFLDCDQAPCTRFRAAIGTHGHLEARA